MQYSSQDNVKREKLWRIQDDETGVGKRQPFPFLKNREIYAVCVLQTKSGKEKLGIVPCSKEVFPELCPAGSVVCVPDSGPSAHQTGIVF